MFRLWRGSVSRVKLNVSSRRDKSTMSAESGDKNADNRSIHSDNIEEVHNVPMHVITRPIPPVLDELKVQSLMETIKVTHLGNMAFFGYIIIHNFNSIRIFQ